MQGNAIRSMRFQVDWPAHPHMVLGTPVAEEKADLSIDFTNPSNKIQIGTDTVNVNSLGFGYDNNDVVLTVPTKDGEPGECVIARKGQQRAPQSTGVNPVGISGSAFKPVTPAPVSGVQKSPVGSSAGNAR